MEDGSNRVASSGEFLRTMIDQIPILAWSCGPDGTAEFLNQRWLDYTGLSPGDALGWGWKGPIHPEDLGKLMDTWLRLLSAGEPGEQEARLRRFDGEYRWFLFRAVPVRHERGKVVRWYGTNTDIEDMKAAEEKHRQSDRELRQLIDIVPQHIFALATMADLYCAGRYDRMSDDVLTLTGQVPLSVQDFVRKNAATFTASAKEATVNV
jgi:PAS domain S-box-containing protein